MSSSAFGGWWSAAAVEMIGLRGREAVLQDLGSAAQGARDGDVRSGAAPPRRHASLGEDGPAPAAAGPSPCRRGAKDTGTGDGVAGAPAAGVSPPGRLSAETAVAILVDCFGHC